ncbi:MAG: glycerate kinase [Sandaracinaceae bacterium]
MGSPRCDARALVDVLVRAALVGCDPTSPTREAIARRTLREPITIVAVGKCAAAMMRGALEACAPTAALVLAPAGPDLEALARRGVEVRIGSPPHPAPDAVDHGREVLELVSRAPASGTVIALVSGGGSSLLEVPAPGVDLAEIREIADKLMRRGVAIDALNAVRRALSDVKGGRLAAACRARVVTLVCEDVPGRPELVASGPTVPCNEFVDTLAIVEDHGIVVSDAARRAMHRTAPTLTRPAELEVVADNASARRAVIAAGATLGLAFQDLGVILGGEARTMGPRVVAEARSRGAPVVCGGETTVTVRGNGLGGRNQELVLGAYLEAPRGLVCAFGTDGVDGRSANAGAFLDPVAWARVSDAAARARAALDENASAAFFEESGSAVVTGPTGTNVADLCFVVPDDG